MTKIGKVFQFEAPDGWKAIQDGSRFIFQGPDRQELIVSASLIQGLGTRVDLTMLQRSLFENAEQAVRKAAMHTALRVTQPFQRDSCTPELECWTLLAQTDDRGTLFYQAVLQHFRGVLIVSFEAINTRDSLVTFDQFVKSVKVVSEKETITG